MKNVIIILTLALLPVFGYGRVGGAGSFRSSHISRSTSRPSSVSRPSPRVSALRNSYHYSATNAMFFMLLYNQHTHRYDTIKAKTESELDNKIVAISQMGERGVTFRFRTTIKDFVLKWKKIKHHEI